MRHFQDYHCPRAAWNGGTIFFPADCPLPSPHPLFDGRMSEYIHGDEVTVKAGIWGERETQVRLSAQVDLMTREIVYVQGVLKGSTPEEVIAAIVSGKTQR